MIGTVTLNPCVDRTCQLKNLEIGGMNRIVSDRRDVSGKGINVSLALTQNDVAVRSCGFIYKGGKEFFLSELERFGICFEGIEVEGQLRENLKLWDCVSNVTTEVNQSGNPVGPDKWEDFKAFFGTFVEGLDMVVLAGSVPKGIDKSAYAQLLAIANEKGIPCILDAEGELLYRGLEQKPFLIKPNLYEFNITFGHEGSDIPSIVAKARQIITEGKCTYICITLGKDGALMVGQEGAWFAPSAKVDVKCTQGAGDSIVSGICKAYFEGKGPDQMLRYGVAMAGGTLSLDGTLMCTKKEFDRVLVDSTVEKLDY